MLRFRAAKRRQNEGGYVLMTLLLMMALMAIFAATLVTSITFDIKRDREEEMIHRGTQYSRAIKAYQTKLGRYPAKLEDLENTSNMRYLRKRYKDPITHQDFKLLRYGDPGVRLALSGGIGGGMIPGASPIGGGPAPAPGVQPFNGSSGGFGGNAGGGFGANQNSPLGQNPQEANQAGNSPTDGTDPSQPGTQPTSQPGAQPGTAGDSSSGSTSGSAAPGSNLGGAAIVGVASTSKDPTIREYNKKKKYNEWQFIFDPAMTQAGLITTPYQPQMMQNAPNVNGQNGGTFPNGTGMPPAGMQNNPNLPGAFGNSNSPPQNTLGTPNQQ